MDNSMSARLKRNKYYVISKQLVSARSTKSVLFKGAVNRM